MRLILNQVCVGHRLEHAWFLENAFAHNVYGMYACVCLCVTLRLLMFCGVILTLYDWLKKF